MKYKNRMSRFLASAMGLMLSGVAMADAPLSLSQQTDAIATQGTSIMSTVGSWLLYAGLGVVTIAVMVQGYKMIFKKHQWGDVGHIFLGAVFIGGASVIAGIFFRVLS
jgi:hypothetical protein